MKTAEADAQVLRDAAEATREAAKTHKRASGYHRRQARDLMARFDELRRECEKRGITLDVD